MESYIKKSAVVAEIEKIIADEAESIKSFEHSKNVSERQRSNARIGVLTHLLSFLDTLEVTGADLDFQRFAKEMEIVFALPSSETKNTEEEPLNWEYVIAKHFFELGMRVSNKARKGEEA